jgi:hypothetical protein
MSHIDQGLCERFAKAAREDGVKQLLHVGVEGLPDCQRKHADTLEHGSFFNSCPISPVSN